MLKISKNPLIAHKLSIIRNQSCKTKEFRQTVEEIATLMSYEVAMDFPLKEVEITTPVAKCQGLELATEIIIVPILRAGLSMVNGVCNVLPDLRVAHIGMYRDEETLQPKAYFEKYPKNIKEATVVVIDPMLATGGSACAAISMLKKQGAKNIALMCIVGAPQGVQCVEQNHGDVDIYLGTLDEGLDEKGYIVPGLGDAGDRIFGT